MRKKACWAIAAFMLVSACAPDPSPAPPPAGQAASEPDSASVAFRARIEFDRDAGLPAEARLVAYVIGGDPVSGEHLAIAQHEGALPEDSPALIEMEVSLDALNPDFVYEVTAAIVDEEGEFLMTSSPVRPPVPALELHRESVFVVRLLSVAPAGPAEVFRLAGPLSLLCGDLPVEAVQENDGRVRLSMSDGAVALRPAVATSGGRFTGRNHDFWVSESGDAMLILRGETPRECKAR